MYTHCILLQDQLKEEIESPLVVAIAAYSALIMFTARVSVAYNVVVAVVRTKGVLRPFSRQRVTVVLAWLLAIPILFTPLIALQIRFKLHNIKS